MLYISSFAMGIFYPDNEKRAARLQQLIDSITNIQVDVKDIGRQMDEKNMQCRPAINALLKANGIDSVDDVINQAASKMPPDERKAFEALIKTIKNTKTGFDTTYFVAGLLMVPKGFVLTGGMTLAIARWGSRMVNVKALANFFAAADEGAEVAAAAASEIAAEAEEAAEALEVAGEAAEAAEVAETVAEAASIASGISTFFDLLAGVGLIVTAIASMVELFEGAEQKAKLIDAIHRLQPARLTTAFLKQEGTNILRQLDILALYLELSPGVSDPGDPALAAKCAERIISISKENGGIDMNELESELEAQDRQSGAFYGGADLSRDEVVAAASKRS